MGNKHDCHDTNNSIMNKQAKPVAIQHEYPLIPSATNSDLLLYGFIKCIEKTLNVIIPIELYKLCNEFYSSNNIIVYINQPSIIQKNIEKPMEFYESNLTNNKYSKQYNIKHITSTPDPSSMLIEASAMLFIKNMQLPNQIRHKLNNLPNSDLKSSSSNSYNIIFKYGGIHKNTDRSYTYCSALLWNATNTDMNDNANDNVFILPLPNITVSNDTCDSRWSQPAIVYSEQHSSLFAVDHMIHELPFDKDYSSKWNWKVLTTKAQGSQYKSACIVQRANSLQDILCVSLQSRGTHLFNLSTKKWNYINDGLFNSNRTKSGIYYDKAKQMVYIGCGNFAENSIEFLDLNKNQWMKTIPPTIMKHNHYPSLWTQHQHILYISSIKGNGIEWIDLRDYRNRWNILTDSLSMYFHADIQKYNSYRSRLLM